MLERVNELLATGGMIAASEPSSVLASVLEPSSRVLGLLADVSPRESAGATRQLRTAGSSSERDELRTWP